ncbi:Isoquinoline 1-oxidoreductase subunit beta [Luteitalea pratensis]|uniref:Isoquinoline 1-oxidoreductase subunit beta n=1 Tax=Luteitalea pratensis TaxID=1855912 RepID=A0A143PT99_LUTPR|nr:molybdopterin cofactor-binding domain-containing protein [Luteitalea pratensis]AMY11378.1 Isoquinoline 1-oxidoreductase subunit beta [Luteitalea pratensis]
MSPVLSRRAFLGGTAAAGAFVLGTRLVPVSVFSQDALAQGPWEPGVYLAILPDGLVQIVAHRSEMGTGIRTSLPLVVADELDADWARVTIVQALGDKKYGSQNTDGSCSIKDFYEPMRVAGATARTMLEQAAAKTWNVLVGEVAARNHAVVHASSGRSLGFGALVATARTLPVPDAASLQFKKAESYRYIGKPIPSTDLDGIVKGQGIYGADVDRPGMVFASISRPPVLGSALTAVDDAAARKVAGVTDVVKLPEAKPPYMFKALGGVAVIGTSTWASMQGRNALKATWSASPNASFDSASFRTMLMDIVKTPGKVEREQGNVDATIGTGTTHEATYYTPMLAHAPMEPPMAVAEVRGGKAEVWTCTQNPQAVQDTVGDALGIPPADVTCHVTLLGGGFGRKSKPDYAAEAALLARQVGKPVKVVWTREDDLQFDYFHAPSAQYLKASVGTSGLPNAWLQRTAFPPIGSTFDEKERYGSFQVGMGFTDIPYPIANLRVENNPAPSPVRIGWLRSVAHIHHAFAVQSFTDELAALAKADRVEYLLKLIGQPRVIDLAAEGVKGFKGEPKHPFDTARLRRVIELVAEKSGWAKKPAAPGRALGIAAHYSFYSYIAAVVEVEVNARGQVTIPRVDIAVDAGTIVSPDRVVAQFEGAAVFGTSIALLSEITASGGKIDQSNFANYVLARQDNAPKQAHVHVVQSTAPPAGVGEPGVPVIAPAIANAIFAATGQRMRELPVRKVSGRA